MSPCAEALSLAPGAREDGMDDYAREMMELKILVTRTLEKKGVLAKIRAELRASVFEAIEEEDQVIENEDGVPPALLGSCNDRAKQLHASPSGRLLTAVICEYLEWAQLGHTLKVYLPECNLQKDFWKAELKDFRLKNGYDLNRNEESSPILLDFLEGYLNYEVWFLCPLCGHLCYKMLGDKISRNMKNGHEDGFFHY